MYSPQKFTIQEIKGQKPDGLGGLIDDWGLFKEVSGYIDLVTGTDETTQQNAFVEESTHILIIPEFTEGITDNMRVVDQKNRYYAVTYSDNPVGVNHHNEIYLKFEGVLSGEERF
ncbi:head-tail adaptor protein [Enterococcus faecalis]|uniref:head-tail adaptor protein n=1 Tax=Enterococcus faecalis TaxID=1351 RepID=UPI001E3BC8DA|nr:head-tail adaptor protein [Enterococcus faecalis]MCD4974293.1 head-tail adaptor protein [Enterococcus faecalis]MCD5228601.1 head-tail adaptor protein [Enterococcus faecalis]MCD5239826.1 head-tail adaptor protein [Enterococcus faecalis]DAG76175.1 MAG TPA: Putative head tail adaptor [Caudoviricetes sp.]